MSCWFTNSCDFFYFLVMLGFLLFVFAAMCMVSIELTHVPSYRNFTSHKVGDTNISFKQRSNVRIWRFGKI